MLHHLHTTIASLLCDERRGQIPPDEVDVLFDIPSRAWVESLPRPAVCCYMFDMAEVAEYRNAGAHIARANGRSVTKPPLRRVDLRYLVCAFSSSRADEQTLIWRAMAVFLKHTTLPPEVMPEKLQQLLRQLGVPVPVKVGAYPEAPKALDLWSALDLPPRPALLLSVTTPMDLELEFEAPLVLSRTVRLARPGDGAMARGAGIDPEKVTARHVATREPLDGVTLSRRVVRVVVDGEPTVIPIDRHTIGGTVRDAEGRPVEGLTVREADHAPRCVTGSDGRFRLDDIAAGVAALVVSLDAETLTEIARHDIATAERVSRLVPAPVTFDVELPWPFELDVERRVVLYHTAGVVRDERGRPIQGVAVSIEGDERVLSTSDEHGRFMLTLPAGDVRLWVCPSSQSRRSLGAALVPAAFDIVLR
jgi:hypothetical protein